MPGLRDLLRKKEKIVRDSSEANALSVPEFKFIRSTTESEEIIQPPSHPDDNVNNNNNNSPRPGRTEKKTEHRRTLGFGKSSPAAPKKEEDQHAGQDPAPPASSGDILEQLAVRPKGERRLSARLHLTRDRRSRSASAEPPASAILPDHLPAAPEAVPAPATPHAPASAEEDREAQERREALWEKRATVLAKSNPFRDSSADERPPTGSSSTEEKSSRARSRSPSISDGKSDVNIQEAIRLHETGDLTASTDMFGRLADPRGANNALAQVLYGLALRHGWGVPVEPAKAIQYLSLAAANSAAIEEAALTAGRRTGGAAKGELVLAIFELANCFRHGWGVRPDPHAARQYYETAANLGDADAMEEAAWCHLEGFGGPKDKFKAAQYLRLAEEKGRKIVGNSWIWKDKYNPK